MVVEGWALMRRRPLLIDAAAALVLLLADLVVAPRLGRTSTPLVLAVLLVALILAAVLLRSRLPVTALVLTTAGSAATLLWVPLGAEALSALAPLLVLYTVALRYGRLVTLLAWAATATILIFAGLLGAQRDFVFPDVLQVVSWTAAAAAIGHGVRNRRAYLAEVEERAARAERSRDEEARRRVVEERMRIARELHDVVAHHIAVVSVQAGVAQHLLTTRPGAASEALVTVRRSAAAVLEELGDILSVLREPDAPSAGTAPAPGLARVDALLESFAAAGLEVDRSWQGQPRELAPTVDLVAYRVLEEGLTNALKHGTGTASLDVQYSATSVVLRLVNRTAAVVTTGSGAIQDLTGNAGAGGERTGHGLLGMHERTSAVGGTLHAAPFEGNAFRVEAHLPLRAIKQ